MAKINTYSTVTPATGDKLLGTDVSDTGADANGASKNFLLSALWNLFVGTTNTLTAGFDSDAEALGTVSSGTVTPEVDADTKENFKTLTNNGAFILAAPSTSSSCSIVIQVTNGASAGAITFSGFAKQDGDALTTTNGDDFFITIVKVGAFSSATVKALQ